VATAPAERAAIYITGRVRQKRNVIGGRKVRHVLAMSLLAVWWPGLAIARIVVRAEPARLTWSVFREQESAGGALEHARLAAEMSFPQPLRIERTDGSYRLPGFTITVAPEPSRTVASRAVRGSDSLLRHEQGHYDIVLLAARALARELEPMTAASTQALTAAVEECVSKHTRRAERLSEAYDAATDHSHDADQQQRWLEKIRAALADAAATELAGFPL